MIDRKIEKSVPGSACTSKSVIWMRAQLVLRLLRAAAVLTAALYDEDEDDDDDENDEDEDDT